MARTDSAMSSRDDDDAGSSTVAFTRANAARGSEELLFGLALTSSTLALAGVLDDACERAVVDVALGADVAATKGLAVHENTNGPHSGQSSSVRENVVAAVVSECDGTSARRTELQTAKHSRHGTTQRAHG